MLLGLICGSSAHGAPSNEVGTQVAALPEEQRQVFFARVLQREGERCPTVTRTFLQGSATDGAMFWSVACGGGGEEWQVMIANTPGGAGKIIECSVLKLLNGPFCFTKFKR